MERLAQLTENLNRLANEGAPKEVMLEMCFDIIRQLKHATNVPQAVEVMAALAPEAVELLLHPAVSLNDAFHTSSPDLSQRLQQLRHGSLRSSMGINDRYLFMETLLKGDAHAFEVMMGLLDEADSYQGCEKIISDYMVPVPRGSDQAAVVEQFQAFVKSRFTAI